MIDAFWRPLFAGIQLDPDLEVSSRRFLLILSMLAEGDAALASLHRLPHGEARRSLESMVEYVLQRIY